MPEVLIPAPVARAGLGRGGAGAARGKGAARAGRTIRWALPTATIVAIVLIGQGVGAAGIIPAGKFPLPSEVAMAFVQALGQPAFWKAVGTTIATTLTGLGIAILIGVPVGIALGLGRRAYLSARVVVDFFRTIPPLAILPLVVLLLGTGPRMLIVLIVLAAVWPILIQSTAGVEGIDPQLRDLSRSFRFSNSKWWFWIVLPGSAPFIATGIRIAATISLLICVGTELIVGSPGIGQLISRALVGSPAAMYAYIVFTGLLGLAFAGVLELLERFVLHWHESVRERVAR